MVGLGTSEEVRQLLKKARVGWTAADGPVVQEAWGPRWCHLSTRWSQAEDVAPAQGSQPFTSAYHGRCPAQLQFQGRQAP